MSNSFHFEMAVRLDDNQSRACSFFGIYDQGRKAVFINKQGTGYIYELPGDKIITQREFKRIVNDSVGRSWTYCKQIGECVDKDVAASNWTISSDYWHGDDNLKTPDSVWVFHSGSLFAF
ncbi:hypothetical protein [Hydrogenovibrio marinus]|uniref:Uncharacterized protein n=1 Tax=Hydrogenovibrio marinus TaxID=28885 RepID=A0A066ZLE9_HYDMR|nr:hypothetical protein [Hydrogenovibrio marinus]KDN94633.1 hypothetical protein EI16_12085 [Hydrogenovibrio marinus]